MKKNPELFVTQKVSVLSREQTANLVKFAAAIIFSTWKEAYDLTKHYDPDDPHKAYMQRIRVGQLTTICQEIDKQLMTFPSEVGRLYKLHQQEYMDGHELKSVN